MRGGDREILVPRASAGQPDSGMDAWMSELLLSAPLSSRRRALGLSTFSVLVMVGVSVPPR